MRYRDRTAGHPSGVHRLNRHIDESETMSYTMPWT